MVFIYFVFLLLCFFSLVHSDNNNNSLDDWIHQQEDTSYQTILDNINPTGTKRGFFAASLSTHEPNYFYTWTRDAALVARTLTLIDKTNDTLLQDYIEFQIDTQFTPTECHCLGEPKFNQDGTGFGGPWGRPQNDGPAERAITFLLIANRWFNNGYQDNTYIYNTLVPAIVRDLDYIIKVWYQPSFDLWEEIKGTHFYTLMVMRKALLDGIDFFHQQKSNKSLEEYKWVAYAMERRIASFWSDQFGYILATQQVTNGVKKPSGLDVSTLLAANLVASRHDGFFTPGSDKILATAFALEESFKSLYPINQQQKSSDLGTCIGRYPEDIYDGYDTSEGNPWFIATVAYTELYYLAIEEWKKVGISVNDINHKFFNRFMTVKKNYYYGSNSSTGKALMTQVQQEADKFLATVQYHQARNGSLSEQYDKYNGFMKGARDLTWSHAATLSAIIQARRKK